MATSLASLDQAVAIQDSENGTDRRRIDHGKLFLELLLDLGRAPGIVFLLQAQNRCFDLEGRLVGMAIGTAGSVFQSPNAFFEIAVVELIACLAADAGFSAGL